MHLPAPPPTPPLSLGSALLSILPAAFVAAHLCLLCIPSRSDICLGSGMHARVPLLPTPRDLFPHLLPYAEGPTRCLPVLSNSPNNFVRRCVPHRPVVKIPSRSCKVSFCIVRTSTMLCLRSLTRHYPAIHITSSSSSGSTLTSISSSKPSRNVPTSLPMPTGSALS